MHTSLIFSLSLSSLINIWVWSCIPINRGSPMMSSISIHTFKLLENSMLVTMETLSLCVPKLLSQVRYYINWLVTFHVSTNGSTHASCSLIRDYSLNNILILSSVSLTMGIETKGLAACMHFYLLHAKCSLSYNMQTVTSMCKHEMKFLWQHREEALQDLQKVTDMLDVSTEVRVAITTRVTWPVITTDQNTCYVTMCTHFLWFHGNK